MNTQRILVLLLLMLLPATVLAQKRKVRIPFGLYTTGDSDIYGISAGIGSDTYMDSDTTSVRSNGLRIEPLSQSLLLFTIIFPVDRVNYPYEEKDYAAFGKKIPNEIINGINLSCGTNAFADVNGITVSAVSQSLKNVNGITIAGIGNYSYSCNGISIGGGSGGSIYAKGLMMSFFNYDVYRGRGLQLSAINNEYTDFKGVQVSFINSIMGKPKAFTGLQIGAFNNAIAPPELFKGLQIGLLNRTKALRGIQIGLWNMNEKRSLPIINWNFKKSS